MIGAWNQFQELFSAKRVVDPLNLREWNELVLSPVDNERGRPHLRRRFIGVVLEAIVIEAAVKRHVPDRWRHGPDAPPQLNR